MPAQARSAWTAPLFASLLLVLLATLLQGQDNNWDLRNYHLYTPAALMDGRLDQDVAAAQLQTWHNPTLDIPFAWMVRAGVPGWLVSLWLALPAFIALLFGLRLLDDLWPAQRSGFRTAIAGLVALCGGAVLPSVGTTFNDAFVAAGAIPALWWAIDSQGRRGPWATWVPVGLLAGLVAGLKLTGAMYCIGFVAAALVSGPARSLPQRLLALALGGIAGAAITAGPWAWRLWQEHGNPLFPYFNQWFQSPDALPIAHSDDRFRPRGLDALLVPFHLLSDSRRFSESMLADPRLLLGGLALGGWAVRWWKSRGDSADDRSPASPWLLIAFTAASYSVWAYLYGIYRYLFALELLLSVVLVGVMSAWLPARFYRTALVSGLLVIVAVANRPGWGRQSFSTPMVDVEYPVFPVDSMVVLAEDAPLAHAVAFLPAQVPALSLANNFMAPDRCTRLQAGVERRISAHTGPLFLLREAKDAPLDHGPFEAYGLSVEGNCMPVKDSLMAVELCPLLRTETATPRCPSPAPDR
ncbi:glycosyltransferase family 87 protein [Pseudoxanthomonas wuyuanensis]